MVIKKKHADKTVLNAPSLNVCESHIIIISSMLPRYMNYILSE